MLITEWRLLPVLVATALGVGCAAWTLLRRGKPADPDRPTPGIPVLDLRALAAAQPASLRALAAACRSPGIFYLVGHGVPEALTLAAHESASRFFGGTDSEKLRSCQLAPTWHPSVRGYVPRGATLSSMEREIFVINPDRRCCASGAEAKEQGEAEFPWPGAIGGHSGQAELFRARLCSYYASMERVSWELLDSMATALGLPAHFFRDKIDRHRSNMEASFSQLHWAEPGEALVNAHVDAEMFTIISHKPPSAGNLLGLQVQFDDGSWMEVQRLRGGLVVNIGSTMVRWTAGQWKAPVHRVVNATPPARLPGAPHPRTAGCKTEEQARQDVRDWFNEQGGEPADAARQCIAFFMHPNHDVHVVPISELSGGPQVKSAASTAGELARLSAKRFTLVGSNMCEKRRARRFLTALPEYQELLEANKHGYQDTVPILGLKVAGGYTHVST